MISTSYALNTDQSCDLKNAAQYTGNLESVWFQP
jgi:hypothetical protein